LARKITGNSFRSNRESVQINGEKERTLRFERLFAFIVFGVARRNIVWVGVAANPTANWLARRTTDAFPWDTFPRFLSAKATAPMIRFFDGFVQWVGPFHLVPVMAQATLLKLG